jgi:hypothetical protein
MSEFFNRLLNCLNVDYLAGIPVSVRLRLTISNSSWITPISSGQRSVVRRELLTKLTNAFRSIGTRYRSEDEPYTGRSVAVWFVVRLLQSILL